MTFADLKTACRASLFSFGEQENLVAAHNQKFLEALIDLQEAVPCYKYGNVDVYPHCASFFDCGMTVIGAPRGQILSVYTIGKNNSSSNGLTDGSTVGTLDIPQVSLLQLVNGVLSVPPATLQTVCTIPSDGIYTVAVTQTNQSYTSFPANAPQYFATTILYTDTNGVNQTVQPADLIHMNVAQNSGTATISAQAGSTIQVQVGCFNSPQTDGAISVDVSVVAGSGQDDLNWCKKVYYDRVEYCWLEKYGRIAAKNTTSTLAQISDALLNNLFGCGEFKVKRRYPAPTDANYAALPPLPQGFHYPQTSTNINGRSPRGFYAVYRGRIYIAPWIESTEAVVVEWNGKKTSWADTDTITDDPKFQKAVTEYVGKEHYTWYESNDVVKADLTRNYAMTVRELINDCRQNNRKTMCSEAGVSPAAAVGIGALSTANGSALFYNDAQSYTATCPAGQTGSPATVTIPNGTVGSALSVADANAQALSQATSQAQAALSCSTQSSVFYNTAQSYTASCPGASGTTPAATGNPVTVTIAAGQYQSSVSQAFANAAALAAAQAQAVAQLACTFYNAPQTAQAVCPTNSAITASATVNAASFTSQLSQADADAQATTAANTAAQGKLTGLGCSSTETITNSQQVVTLSGSTIPPGCTVAFNYNIVITIPAGTYSQQSTVANAATVQASLNQQALAAANLQAQEALAFQSASFRATNCGTILDGGGPITNV